MVRHAAQQATGHEVVDALAGEGPRHLEAVRHRGDRDELHLRRRWGGWGGDRQDGVSRARAVCGVRACGRQPASRTPHLGHLGQQAVERLLVKRHQVEELLAYLALGPLLHGRVGAVVDLTFLRKLLLYFNHFKIY